MFIGHMYCTCMGMHDNFCTWAEYYPISLKELKFIGAAYNMLEITKLILIHGQCFGAVDAHFTP